LAACDLPGQLVETREILAHAMEDRMKTVSAGMTALTLWSGAALAQTATPPLGASSETKTVHTQDAYGDTRDSKSTTTQDAQGVTKDSQTTTTIAAPPPPPPPAATTTTTETQTTTVPR
jgi:hypothetical protein